MAQRSLRHREMKEKTELRCMSGLFSILESRQNRSSPVTISSGGPVKKHVIESSRKLEQRTSTQEECRKIQNEASRDSNGLSSTSVGNLIQEDMSIEKLQNKQIIVKGQRHTKADPEFLNQVMKTHKKTRKNSRKASSNAVFEPSLSPLEISFNKLSISEILGAVCDQNHHEKNLLSESFRRSVHYNQADKISMRQVQMSAKAFVDQMFIDRKFKEGLSSKYKPFSNALDVLNSNKDLFVDLLREPDSFLAKCIKNMQSPQKKGETIETVLESRVSEGESKDGRDSEVSACTLTREMNKDLWEEMNNQSHCSLTTNRSSDKIDILEPASENKKRSEDVSCHCSSHQYHKRLGDKQMKDKPSAFTFGEIKRRLKYRLANNRNEPNRVLVDCGEDKQLSSDNSKTKEDLIKKEDLKSKKRSNVISLNDMMHKKLDFSSVKFPSKQEFDVILEGKKHLCARLKNLNAVESTMSKRSPKTLGRVLSSPEHDFRPSPSRDSNYCSGSAQMRFSPYNATTIKSGKHRTCLNPLRQNNEISIDGANEELPNILIAAKEAKSNDDQKMVEVNDILLTEASISAVNGDSLSENETSACMVDGFPSTPSGIYRLGVLDNNKYQEEHQSPVSVLEPFFSEDGNSPPCITHQTAAEQTKPHHFDFEDCLFEPFSQDIHKARANEKDYISHYVHLVLKASCLNWDLLSENRPPQETLLHSSLFDELKFQPNDIYFDSRLLFDLINEVLQKIYQSHSSTLTKPKTCSVPLEKQVLDEIMDFYLHTRTEQTTLDQIVSKDIIGCRSWLDVRHYTEEIAVCISEDLVMESILDMFLEFQS